MVETCFSGFWLWAKLAWMWTDGNVLTLVPAHRHDWEDSNLQASGSGGGDQSAPALSPQAGRIQYRSHQAVERWRKTDLPCCLCYGLHRAVVCCFDCSVWWWLYSVVDQWLSGTNYGGTLRQKPSCVIAIEDCVRKTDNKMKLCSQDVCQTLLWAEVEFTGVLEGYISGLGNFPGSSLSVTGACYNHC